MSFPASAKPVRVWLERDGAPVLYTLSISSPCTDLFVEGVELRCQAKKDGLSLPAIRIRIRAWMGTEPDVEKVAVTYGAGRYTAAILANPLTRQIMTCLHVGFDNVRDVFRDHRPIVYVVGPEQRDATMLYSPQCCVSRYD